MRGYFECKAAAQKLRRIAGLDDPVPAVVVVDQSSEDAAAVELPSMKPFSVEADAAEASAWTTPTGFRRAADKARRIALVRTWQGTDV